MGALSSGSFITKHPGRDNGQHGSYHPARRPMHCGIQYFHSSLVHSGLSILLGDLEFLLKAFDSNMHLFARQP